ncbi:MAG: ABC transporter permease [Cyclobacteriaceae bacterium]|nr:ABC transporter permease [Cyclobacteriaceae bacterium]
MLKNYLITGFRTLMRKRGTTMINLGGLTLGISGTIILILILQYHTSFDRFQTKYDRIYRIVTSGKGNDGEWGYTAGVPTVLPPAFRLDFPQAEEVVFTQYRANSLILIPQRDGDFKKFEEERGVVVTEPNIFRVFDRVVLMGDAEKSLDEPNEAVISRSFALKYFGREDAIGELVRFEERDYRIGAVVEDPPAQSDLPFYLLLSYETIRANNESRGWRSIWSDENCYFLLREGESVTSIENQLAEFSKKHDPETSWDQRRYVIQPLSDLHFNDDIGNYNYNAVSEDYLMALGVVSLFLIVTACINFINITTAEAIRRSKEVGIRKSLGGSRSQLVFQFLGETSLVTFGAMMLSFVIVQGVLGVVNSFLELSLTFDLAGNPHLLIVLIGVFIIVSLLSGLYPALVISGFNPVSALKNSAASKFTSGYRLRQGLVVTQFVISQLLVILTLVLINQMEFFRNKDLGFRKDAIITIPVPEGSRLDTLNVSKARALANDISRMAGVEGYSLCFSAPSSGYQMSSDFLMEGQQEEQAKGTQVKLADGNYISLFEIKLLAGQNIEDLDTPRSVVVNRKFTEVAGFSSPEEIIGKRVRLWGRMLPVVGVVENFHTLSLSNAIQPVAIQNRLDRYRLMALRIQPDQFQQLVPQIQKRWEEAYPLSIFSYEFLDENIREFYESEARSSTMLTVFSAIAIAIGCLGLLGLATYMANQKTKEIGIRKTLGASVESILLMFTRDFIMLVLLGFVVAAPLAWWLGNLYLSQFVYRIELGPVLFLSGIGLTLLIAMITVGYKSFRAATVNPVDSLRYE